MKTLRALADAAVRLAVDDAVTWAKRVRAWRAKRLDDLSPSEELPDGAPRARVIFAVKRSAWQQHRKALGDHKGGALHNRWNPIGDERVLDLDASDPWAAKVRAHCVAAKITLRETGGA